MSDVAIRTRGLGKRYELGEFAAGTMGEAAFRALKRIARGEFRRRKAPELWALKDVDLDVSPGDVVGLIGRNGAGKSTLLKVLSRITDPTEGVAEIHGRVGSLLEVGTGFHWELTGRENIFLNGAILGMKREEIVRHFDEIVAFSEIEDFVDTAVKHYSTGMYLRLAFAVAAHLTPEILLVDEVLAVGDAAFQRKCLGRMEDVARGGRTVALVSHNMAAIQNLCRRCAVLDGGRLVYFGDTVGAIERYNQILRTPDEDGRAEGADVAFHDLRINGATEGRVGNDEPLRFSFGLSIRIRFTGMRLFGIVQGPDGQTLVHARVDQREMPEVSGPGDYRVVLEVPPLALRTGVYSMHAKLLCDGVGYGGRYVSDNLILAVEGPSDPGAMVGLLSPAVTWRVSPLHEADAPIERVV